MNDQVKTIAILTALPGKAEDLRALLEGMIAPSRAEPGNLRYDLWGDRADPEKFVLDELYTDATALAEHRASAHFQAYLGQVNALAERLALSLDALAVR
ncbi:putative quinol monooxygenase [Flavisphingomonas formosensis]|uniref:putative quinol monooxygenase n=1 Tax=Flavisphingomonas formosensis TaxID=861534 RepID=UPI0012F9A51A|nr:putative quinol monooxygenase [Sphingomonas formosensis]